jgi:uncharacterized membrane protein YdbT with pleckstrin-like domain
MAATSTIPARPRPETVQNPFPTLPTTRAPDPSLLGYYVLSSLAAGPFFLFVLIPLFFKYRTLRYELDEEGITMRWGILFRREISLAYARIQDIHLSSNVIERWFGLAKIQVQTASASAKAEMTIEGLRDYEAIRDFLYTRMRGARDGVSAATTQAGSAHAPALLDELTSTLREVAAELRAVRRLLEAPQGEEAADG